MLLQVKCPVGYLIQALPTRVITLKDGPVLTWAGLIPAVSPALPSTRPITGQTLRKHQLNEVPAGLMVVP